DDRLGVWRDAFEVLQDLDAAQPGHAQVQDGGVVGALLQGLDGGLAVGANGDLVPQARQLGTHELLQRLLVIGEQDPQALVRRRRQGSSPSFLGPWSVHQVHLVHWQWTDWTKWTAHAAWRC